MTSGYVAMKKKFLGGGYLGFFITVMSVNVTAKWATNLESLSVKLNIEFVFIIAVRMTVTGQRRQQIELLYFVIFCIFL